MTQTVTGPPNQAFAGAVKLVVAGGYGAGKTTLVRTLSDIEPISTESAITSLGRRADSEASASKTSTTVAFDFGRFTVAPDLMGYVFGLPGQSRFRFLWPDLVRGAFGGLVIVDPDRCHDAGPALDWLRRHGVPSVLVVNAFDGLVLADLDSVRSAIVGSGPEPVIVADARDRLTVRSAIGTLLRSAASRYQQGV